MPAIKSRSPLRNTLILAVMLTCPVVAAELPGHDDEPLDMDPSLSLEMAVDLTLGSRFYKRIQGHLLNLLSAVVMPLHKLDYYDEDSIPDEE